MASRSLLLTVRRRLGALISDTAPLGTNPFVSSGGTGNGTQAYPISITTLTISYSAARPTINVTASGLFRYSWSSVTSDTHFGIYKMFGGTAYVQGTEWQDSQQVNIGAYSSSFSVAVGDVIRIGYPGDQTVINGFTYYWSAS